MIYTNNILREMLATTFSTITLLLDEIHVDLITLCVIYFYNISETLMNFIQ